MVCYRTCKTALLQRDICSRLQYHVHSGDGYILLFDCCLLSWAHAVSVQHVCFSFAIFLWASISYFVSTPGRCETSIVLLHVSSVSWSVIKCCRKLILTCLAAHHRSEGSFCDAMVPSILSSVLDTCEEYDSWCTQTMDLLMILKRNVCLVCSSQC